MRLSFHIQDGLADGEAFVPLRHRVRSFEPILKEIVPLPEPVLPEHHKLLGNFGAAMAGLREQAARTARFVRHAYGLAIALPTLPTAGLEITRLPFEQAQAELRLRYDAAVRDVARLLQSNRVGRVTWAGDDKVRFDYVEAIDEMGLLRWYRHRVQHTHELVKAVSRSLSEPGAPMDRRTRELIALMPDEWKPYAQIITGLEVLKEQAQAGTDEHLTGFGRAVQGAQHGAGLAAAAAVGAGLAGAAAWHWLTAAMSVAVADPCLALGEYCLHGWED